MKHVDEVNMYLDEPLDGNVVEQRQGYGGTSLEYVPGWYVFAKANQVFGPDGWDRETVSMDFFQGDNGVKAVAKSRITVRVKTEDGVLAVQREGTGGGEGYNADAYEDAAKEAEKDAAKRAFATFGQQFGLSLYQGGGELEIDLGEPSWFSARQKRRLREAWRESDVGPEEARDIFQRAESQEWSFEETLSNFKDL